MPVNDAQTGDVYADENGKLWRIIAICHEPTVDAEEVEGTLHDPSALPSLYAAHGQGIAQAQITFAARASIIKRRVSGGMGGLMWKGWKRIWRNDQRTNQSPMPDEGPREVQG